MFDLRTLTVAYIVAALFMLAVFIQSRMFLSAALLSSTVSVLALSKVPVRWIVPRPIRRAMRSAYWSARNRVYRMRARLQLF